MRIEGNLPMQFARTFAGRMKEDSRVRSWRGLELSMQFEIGEVMAIHRARVEEVRKPAAAMNASVLRDKGFRFFVGGPAFEGFAVEQ